MNSSKARNQRLSIQIATLVFAISAAIVAWSITTYLGAREERQLEAQLTKIAEKINLWLSDQSICNVALTTREQIASVDKMSDIVLSLKSEGLGELKAGSVLAAQNVAVSELRIEDIALLGESPDQKIQYFRSRLYLSVHFVPEASDSRFKVIGRNLTEFTLKKDKATRVVEGCASQKNERLCVSRGRIYIPENAIPALPNAPKDADGCANFNAISFVSN